MATFSSHESSSSKENSRANNSPGICSRGTPERLVAQAVQSAACASVACRSGPAHPFKLASGDSATGPWRTPGSVTHGILMSGPNGARGRAQRDAPPTCRPTTVLSPINGDAATTLLIGPPTVHASLGGGGSSAGPAAGRLHARVTSVRSRGGVVARSDRADGAF